jgi:regulator of replication initiation timing
VGLQEALERERQNTQRLLEEKERLAEEKAAERERLAEERTAKAIEEAEARHAASNRALYELFVVSHLFIFTQKMHVIMFVYISN